MRIVYFAHSLQSCWNNGNAHFQRGILRALHRLGHDVIACEAERSWSLDNLIAEQGVPVAEAFGRSSPEFATVFYGSFEDVSGAVERADLVIVHEWNDPALVQAIGRLRRQGHFTLLFHDTHHRAVSDPDAIRRFDLSDYDGVLAFGAALARVYEGWGWRSRVFIWHEAADTARFGPPSSAPARAGAVWVGNWGDGERTAELETYLLAPAQRAGVDLTVYGVRYPNMALDMLRRYDATFRGWLANAEVPDVFARYCLTVHVPRRYYSQMLPGIPTIRVFESLACGLPLITAPWDDCEHLFDPGTHYLVARDGDEMARHIRAISHDTELATALAEAGLSHIIAKHSCDVRALELLDIVDRLALRAVAA